MTQNEPTPSDTHRGVLNRLAELESNPNGVHYLVATTANSLDMLVGPGHCVIWSTADAMRRRGWVRLDRRHETMLHCNNRYTAVTLTEEGRELAARLQEG